MYPEFMGHLGNEQPYFERSDFLSQLAKTQIPTPKSSRAIYLPEHSLGRADPTLGKLTTGLLFPKFSKALDEKNTKLSATELRNEKCSAAIEKKSQAKWRKVEPNANEELVKLTEVRKVKEGLQKKRCGPKATLGQQSLIHRAQRANK